MHALLDLGVLPEKMIFANPVKSIPHFKFSCEKGIKKMTFDSKEELQKIARYFPDAECVLRIATKETTAAYNLNEKFGA
jgi:ornithine decarboxylase